MGLFCKFVNVSERRRTSSWRRRRDSNPRYGFRPYNGLANRRLQPLGHLSIKYFQTLSRAPQRTNVDIATGLPPDTSAIQAGLFLLRPDAREHRLHCLGRLLLRVAVQVAADVERDLGIGMPEAATYRQDVDTGSNQA